MHLVGWFIWIYDDARSYKPYIQSNWRKAKCHSTATLTVGGRDTGSLNRLQAGTEAMTKKRTCKTLNPTYRLAHSSVAVPNTTVVWHLTPSSMTHLPTFRGKLPSTLQKKKKKKKGCHLGSKAVQHDEVTAASEKVSILRVKKVKKRTGSQGKIMGQQE